MLSVTWLYADLAHVTDMPIDVYHYRELNLNLIWYTVDVSAPTIPKVETAKNVKTFLTICHGDLLLENKLMPAKVRHFFYIKLILLPNVAAKKERFDLT